MRQELACALCVECSGWRALPRLDHKPSHDGFEHRSTHEELRNDLDAPWISLPTFRDHTRQKNVGYEHHNGVRGSVRLPRPVEIGGSDIDGTRISPSLDQSTACFSANTMSAGRVQTQHGIG